MGDENNVDIRQRGRRAAVIRRVRCPRRSLVLSPDWASYTAYLTPDGLREALVGTRQASGARSGRGHRSVIVVWRGCIQLLYSDRRGRGRGGDWAEQAGRRPHMIPSPRAAPSTGHSQESRGCEAASPMRREETHNLALMLDGDTNRLPGVVRCFSL